LLNSCSLWLGCRTLCGSDADNTDMLILKCGSDAEHLTLVNLEMWFGCRTFLENYGSDAELQFYTTH
jgi:hypothetical protein